MKGQGKTPAKDDKLIYDTVAKTECLYITDSLTGKGQIGYLRRVITSKMELRAPSGAKNTDDSVVMKQTKVALSAHYYELNSWHEVAVLYDYQIDLTIPKKQEDSVPPIKRTKTISNKPNH